MSRHRAPEELLLDYAAGTLPEGPALAVALHVAEEDVRAQLAARRARLDAGQVDVPNGELGHGSHQGTWFVAQPPVQGLAYEMDVRGRVNLLMADGDL